MQVLFHLAECTFWLGPILQHNSLEEEERLVPGRNRVYLFQGQCRDLFACFTVVLSEP
jgi:hypothetical protein